MFDQLLRVTASIITKLALMGHVLENLVAFLELGPVTSSRGGPGKLAIVQCLVKGEFFLVVGTEVAKAALIRSIVGMSSLMDRQMRGLTEVFVTKIALKWFFTSVHTLVNNR